MKENILKRNILLVLFLLALPFLTTGIFAEEQISLTIRAYAEESGTSTETGTQETEASEETTAGELSMEETTETVSSDEELLFTGWVTKNGSKFYYKDGEKVTGWKKISGKYYYFSASGKMQTNKIVGSKKKGYYYVDKTGVRVTTSQIKSAVAFVVKNSSSSQTRKQRLKSCFEALCKYPYTRYYDGAPNASTAASYASDMFKNKTGNCYRYATAMVYIARVLGYDSRLAVGGVTSSAYRSLSEHGWCEVKIGSTWRMIDCSMQRATTRYSLFLMKRSEYPYRFRCDKVYTMTVKKGKVKWK